MDDDIVNRLRDLDGKPVWWFQISWNDIVEAADEIERLRKQRNNLAWAIAWFLNGGSREKLEQRFANYEETINEQK